MNGIEEAFAWIRENLHRGESMDSIHAEGLEEDPVRDFILATTRTYYDESAPPSEAIDNAEARTRGLLDEMQRLHISIGAPSVASVPTPRWRRHFRVIEVVYDASQEREDNPEKTDLATLARMINEGSVHGSELTQQDIPVDLARELVRFEGIYADLTPEEKG